MWCCSKNVDRAEFSGQTMAWHGMAWQLTHPIGGLQVDEMKLIELMEKITTGA